MYITEQISLYTTICRPNLGLNQVQTHGDWGLFPHGLKMNVDKPSVPPHMEMY